MAERIVSLHAAHRRGKEVVETYYTLEGCALKQTSLDSPRAVNNIVDRTPYVRKLHGSDYL